jgi:hypothetical protein
VTGTAAVTGIDSEFHGCSAYSVTYTAKWKGR